ncbi:MAG TPA: hypothetical protein PKB04_00100 [Phenylobacterium sp.]|uniref:hypothetical protein n=1 Tax=Phenylobacterium sp. TaxID=1871053 RepID=UPI002BB5D048|nr:hypothetical protein [Phenylobacterium sp.]
MIEKALAGVIGLAALFGVTLLCIGAAGFALYFLLVGPLGPAGAAGVLALVCLLLLGGALLAVRGKSPLPPALQDEDSLAVRAFLIAKQHPVAAASAAAVAVAALGALAVKNPKVIATAVSAFLAGRSAGRH